MRIDREGVQNISTGERSAMILADQLEVSATPHLLETLSCKVEAFY